MLKVKLAPNSVAFPRVFGITDGKKWFGYCYTDQAMAHKVLKRIEGYSEAIVKQNIAYDHPNILIS